MQTPTTTTTTGVEGKEWAEQYGGHLRTAGESFSGLLTGAPEKAIRIDPPTIFNRWVEPKSTIHRVRLVKDGDSDGAETVYGGGSKTTMRTAIYDEKDETMDHPWVVKWTRRSATTDAPPEEEAPRSSPHFDKKNKGTTPRTSKGNGYHQVAVGPHEWELDPLRVRKAEGTIRVCCVSDTHNNHKLLDAFIPADGSIDLIVHGGDFSDVGSQKDVADFCEWVRNIRVSHNIAESAVIAGNHDLSLDYEFYEEAYVRFGCQRLKQNTTIDKMRSSCMYLDHQGVVTDSGLKVFGSPYQPAFCDWAFNLPRGTGEDGRCREMWATMPKSKTDILLTHGPPMGHGDWVYNRKNERERFGCPDLLDFVEAFPPKLHVFGHIHEGHGVTYNGKTLFVNASSMDENYNALSVHLPVIVDVPV